MGRNHIWYWHDGTAVCAQDPFILKINHNELLSHPNTYDQIMFAKVRRLGHGLCGHRRNHLLWLTRIKSPDTRGIQSVRHGS